MTKRFANPSRSRATRGAKTLGFERDLLFRSIDDEGDDTNALLVRPRHSRARSCHGTGSPVRPPFFGRIFEGEATRRGFLEASFSASSPLLAMRWSGCAATAEVSERGMARVNRKPTTSTRSPPLPLSLRRLPAFRCGSLDGACTLACTHRFDDGSLQATTPNLMLPTTR